MCRPQPRIAGRPARCPRPACPTRPQAVPDWKVFGPTAEYSDGDAEYFRVTNQLADQYEWFAPRQQPEEGVDEEQERSEFGLSPHQIAALGLSGPRSALPSSVRVQRGRGGATDGP